MTDDSQWPEPADGDATVPGGPNEDAIRALVERLARRHPSGGTVIERAAILAEGADSAAVVAWIIAHDGKPEAAIAAPSRGLHGPRLSDPMATQSRPPLRYVLPADLPA
jgi:hypothetical protein